MSIVVIQFWLNLVICFSVTEYVCLSNHKISNSSFVLFFQLFVEGYQHYEFCVVPELTEESSRLAKQSKNRDKSQEEEKMDEKDGYAILLYESNSKVLNYNVLIALTFSSST